MVIVIDDKSFGSKIEVIAYAYGLRGRRFYFYSGDADNIGILACKAGEMMICIRKKDELVLAIIRNPIFDRKMKKELNGILDGEFIVDIKNAEIIYDLDKKTEINWFTPFPQKDLPNFKSILTLSINMDTKKESLALIENNKAIGLLSIANIQTRSSLLLKPKEATEFGCEIYYKIMQRRLQLDGTVSLGQYKEYTIPTKEINYVSESLTDGLNLLLAEIKNKVTALLAKPKEEFSLSNIIRSGFVPVVRELTKLKMDTPILPEYKFTGASITMNGFIQFNSMDETVRKNFDSILFKLREVLGLEEVILTYDGRFNEDETME